MFSLLIVDDMRTEREGLKRYVDWASLGFRIAGDCASAAEALAYIEAHCVDALLTDIVMPDVDGLDLAREARLINPQIKVIILSAYERFEYAREAIRLGTVSYLTKPVDFGLLRQEFLQLRAMLEKEALERTHQRQFKHIAREQFLNNLVHHAYGNADDIGERVRLNDLPSQERPFYAIRCLAGRSEPADGDFRRQMESVVDRLETLFQEQGEAFFFITGSAEVSWLYYPHPAVDAKACVQKAREQLREWLGRDVVMGVGACRERIELAAGSWFEAGKALEYRLIQRHESVLFHDEISQFFRGRLLVAEETEARILDRMMHRDWSGLQTLMEGILGDAMASGPADGALVYDLCVEILLIVNKYMAANADTRDTQGHSDHQSVKALLTQPGGREAAAYMRSYVDACRERLERHGTRSAGLIAENAKKYMDEHYREEITLLTLSRIVYVNPTYLSRLFKDRVGMNFSDYLTHVRMHHAKRLLEDLSLRIYDITEMVGYESRKHFWKTFKDQTGMSPREYRNSLVV